jgi:Protein of unknown function (DUF3568)
MFHSSIRVLRGVCVAAVLCLLLLPQSGCIALCAAAGAGAGVAYVRGSSEGTLEGSPEQVATAAEQAFLQLGLVVVSSTSGPANAEVVARTQRDEKVDVTVTAESANLSRVEVRVGTFGDRTLQGRVLGEISDHLAMARTAPPAPAEPTGGDRAGN